MQYIKTRKSSDSKEYKAMNGLCNYHISEIKYCWQDRSIYDILFRQEYIGDTVNFKGTTKSFLKIKVKFIFQKNNGRYLKIHMSLSLIKKLGILYNAFEKIDNALLRLVK